MTACSLQSEAVMEFRHDRERDRTILHRRRAGGLCHLSKPYWTGEVLAAQMVNPTAGIFAGDEWRLKVRVREGARVAMTSPSATRFHAMAGGRARLEQDFAVEAGAWLDFQPEWTIPQADSEVEQVTRIDLRAGARMAFLDLLAPGRVAHGEHHAYRRYHTTMEVRRDGELVARERMDLSPDSGGWPLLVPGWEACFYGAAWFAGPSAVDLDECMSALENELHGSGVKCGATRLAEEVVVVRLLAARSIPLKRSLTAVRQAMAPAFPGLGANFRKI